MSQDDDPFADDKTVLRPSAKRPTPGGARGEVEGDKTVLRPTPGRRPSTGGADAAPPPRAPARRAPSAPEPVAIRGSGLSPLMDAATGLLVLVPQLRGTPRHPDVGGLRTHLVQELKQFDSSARSAGVANETVVAARYALCTLLDEAVLSTPWGSESPWSRQTLLSAFHNETWGGEKVFLILDRMLQAPGRNLDFLELMYVCLALGFEGKYRVLEGGRRQLESIQDNLYRTLRAQRKDYERDLSPHWQGIVDRRNALVRYVPLWVVGALAAALLTVLYVGFTFQLTGAADPAFSRLQGIGREPPPVVAIAVPEPEPPPPPPPKPRTLDLREFLAPEIQQGLVEVTEQGGRTTVVIRGDGLFSSGSAVVQDKVRPLLKRIAQEIDRVPGRVVITGHTDSVPIRTLRFPSNWHLSQARADSVARIMAADLGAPERITAEGRAESEPRAPNDTPQNRARNRRVEIVLIAQGEGA